MQISNRFRYYGISGNFSGVFRSAVRPTHWDGGTKITFQRSQEALSYDNVGVTIFSLPFGAVTTVILHPGLGDETRTGA